VPPHIYFIALRTAVTRLLCSNKWRRGSGNGEEAEEEDGTAPQQWRQTVTLRTLTGIVIVTELGGCGPARKMKSNECGS
jgi:hypothetical protein